MSGKTRKLIVVATVASFLVIGLTACGRYFTPNINLDRYATEKDIVGTWQLLPSTLQFAARDGYKAEAPVHEIEFRADGSCVYRSITEFGQKATYLNAQGTWKLEHDTEGKGERKRKNEIKLMLNHHGLSFYLTEENGKILLWYWWGDPDSWEFIKYEKKG